MFEVWVDFPKFSTELKLYEAPLGSYDIIIVINSLSENKAKIDYLAKIVECLDDQGNLVSIKRVPHESKPHQISIMQLKRCERKGCEILQLESKI